MPEILHYKYFRHSIHIYAIMRHMSSFRLRWWPGRYEVPCSVITRKRGGVIFSNGLSMLWSDHSYRPLKSRPSFLPSLFIINKNCIHLQQFVNKIWLELKFYARNNILLAFKLFWLFSAWVVFLSSFHLE